MDKKIYCLNNNKNCRVCVTDYARWAGFEYTIIDFIDEYPNDESSILMCSTHGLFPDEADCICDALTSHRRECGRASDVEIEGLRGKVGRIGRVSEWRLMCKGRYNWYSL